MSEKLDHLTAIILNIEAGQKNRKKRQKPRELPPTQQKQGSKIVIFRNKNFSIESILRSHKVSYSILFKQFYRLSEFFEVSEKTDFREDSEGSKKSENSPSSTFESLVIIY